MSDKKSPTPTLSCAPESEKSSAEPKPLSRLREREGPVAKQREGEGRPPASPQPAKKLPETGGPEGPEPTRYGDWERKGRCIDF
ncbi:MAG TPA: DUF1674 domain-containing protein [Alphaproteobacteria bacterium]|nr:DUF1674 domain-containing protein [Alphaproteobacteria bacterium]